MNGVMCDVCRMQGTGSRENGRGVGYVGAREMALHSSSKDRSDAIAAVRCVISIHRRCHISPMLLTRVFAFVSFGLSVGQIMQKSS